jgi:PAS domain S-box-containing protein
MALSVAYIIAALLGFRAAFVAQQVTTVWAPTGIAQAALLLCGIKLWPAVWLGAFTANALTHIPLWTAAGIATGNTLEAVAAAWILPRLGFDPAFKRTRAAIAFILIAVVASPIISASIGVTMLSAAGATPGTRFIELWWEWWLGDALGALVVAPAILTVVRAGRLARDRELEAIGLVALTAVTTQVVSGQLFSTPFGNPPLAFVIFPFVIVAAARLGQPATALVIFSAAAIITLNTLQGYRPFGAPTIQENLLLVHVFMGVLAGSGLLLAAAITERRVLERRRAATYAAGSAIAGSSSVEETASRVLGAICSNLGWRAGGFWLVDPKLDRLRCLATWPDDGTASGFLAVTREMTFTRGTGLPGRVWATGEPAWIEDVVNDPNFPRATVAKQTGLHGGFAFPIRRNDELVGIVEFFSESIAAVDHDLLATMASIAYQIGDFLSRTRTEAAVVSEQTRTRAILETALDAIISMNDQGHITEFNGAAERMFGFSRSEAIGRELATLIVPKALRDSHRAGLATYLRTGHGPFMDRRVETTALRSDGSEFPVEVAITKVLTNPTLFTGFVRDVTDRVNLERDRVALLQAELVARHEAEAANRAKDEFLATLSHELRTPLNAIVGWTRMLLDGTLDEQSARRALTIVDRNAHAQAQLVTDLLDVSRIITGKLSLNLRPLDLGSVIGAALDTVRPAAEAKHIRITSKLSSAARLTSGDFQRLQQIVWNLLSNAIKFTPEGGSVDVQLLEHGAGKLRLSVTDSGIGIAPEFLPRVFDRFRQADSSSTRQHGGLGLGLAIVRHLVEQHGGSVFAESKGPGTGATFIVELPQSADRSSFILSTADSRRRSSDGQPLTGCRVFVLEDEEDARKLVEAVLTRTGAVVRQASSVDTALEMLREQPADVVLADVGLPGKDGYDFVQELRAIEGNQRHTAVAAVTAYARPEDRESLLSAGFDAHVAKPVEPRILVDTVMELWKNPRPVSR